MGDEEATSSSNIAQPTPVRGGGGSILTSPKLIRPQVIESSSSPAPSSYVSDRVKQMSVLVDPINISWEGISLRVPVKGSKTKKHILSNVSGDIKAGQVTAIMGPSGCGKSSLLNVLAGRVQAVKGAELEGRLLTNGKKREEAEFRHVVGYVSQDDTLYSQLTVLETLTLATHFKLGTSMGSVEDYVMSVINDMGLKKCRDTVIGDAFTKGVSGGERKRVAIGVELISNPSVLFLDEPTSGLDAFQALSVIASMKELAGTGRTIITVVHQPRSSIFATLDRLVLLSEGRIIYLGPTADAPAYFDRHGFECPSHSSPADFLLDVVAKDYRTPKLAALSQQRIDVLIQAYEEKQQQAHQRRKEEEEEEGKTKAAAARAIKASPALVTKKEMSSQPPNASASEETHGAGWWTQVWYLAWRNVMVASRNKVARIVGVGLPVFFGLLFGAIWSNRSASTQAQIQDRVGLLFMVVTLIGFMGMSELLQTFPLEKKTVQKERASGFYSLSAYYVAKVLTILPFTAIGPLLMCCIVYPAAGLRQGVGYFFIFVAVVVAQMTAAGGLGMLLSTIASDPELANAMAPAFNIVFTVFNGVLINVDDLPNGSQWLAVIGYSRWSFEALAINEFRDRPYDCGPTTNPSACVTDGNQVLDLYAYADGSVAYCILWLAVIWAVFHSLAFFNLWRNATIYMQVHEPFAAAAQQAVAESSHAAAAKGEVAMKVSVLPPSKEEEEEALEEVDAQQGGAASMAPVGLVDLTWQDVELKVPVKKKLYERESSSTPVYKTVLDKVSGEIRSGTLTAIMGPTGSGKSSLLTVLAGRLLQVKGGVLTGELEENGHPRDAETFKKVSAFVPQDDLLFGHLTVLETLTLAAHFALGTSLSPARKNALVMGVITDLGLAKALNTIIGDERVRGVSGGERKRVAIGVELISNPSVLFLDEPTSGLDAFQALSVMSTMQRLAHVGQRTVVAVIHQPRSAIYSLLDELILISEGRTIFIGHATEAVRHFASLGFVCPPQYNASDFFLDTISMDYRTGALETATRERITQLADAWRDNGGQKYAEGEKEEDDDEAMIKVPPVPTLKTKPSCSDLSTLSAVPIHLRGGWMNNLYYLTWRAFQSAYRNVFAITLRVVLQIVFALIFSGIWHDVQNDQTGIQSFVGIIFLVSTNAAFINTQAVINSFPTEKSIVQKEQASNSYRLSAYFLSKFLAELPLNILGPSIFATLVFWIINFQHDLAHYGVFLATVCLSALAAIGLGTFISTLAPNTEVAAALSPVFNVLFLIFSGVLINIDSLPAGAQWVPYISTIKWSVNALALNEFTGATFTCTPGQRCLATGEEVLSLYSWDGTTVGHCLMYIVIIMATFLLLGYLVLKNSLPTYMKCLGKHSHEGVCVCLRPPPNAVSESLPTNADTAAVAATVVALGQK